MKIAFYKGTRPGIVGIYNRLVRFVCATPYSHCELVFSDSMSGSSSFMDKGVRLKKIEYGNESHWDFIELDDSYNELNARLWFTEHAGASYDVLGALRFAIAFWKESENDWFCSEAVGAALGIDNPAQLHPGTLYRLAWRTKQ